MTGKPACEGMYKTVTAPVGAVHWAALTWDAEKRRSGRPAGPPLQVPHDFRALCRGGFSSLPLFIGPGGAGKLRCDIFSLTFFNLSGIILC